MCAYEGSATELFILIEYQFDITLGEINSDRSVVAICSDFFICN